MQQFPKDMYLYFAICILFKFISYATYVWPEILRNKVLFCSVLYNTQ